MQVKHKKILVTGGAGFIGSHLVDALITREADVFIIDDLSTGRKENINSKAKFYHLDMADPAVARIIKKEKPEIVFHLGFNTNVPKSVDDPLFDARGITCSLNIYINSIESGVKKIVMASSAFVYGNQSPRVFPVTEKNDVQPVSPYAISKIASENYLRYFHNVSNLPIVILRYGTVYGPRQVTGAMADYIRKLSAGLAADMYGDGNLTRDYVYVDDIVRANLLALGFNKKNIEPIFNLGSGVEITLNELHQRIADILYRSDIKPAYHPARRGDISRFCVSNDEAKKHLKWQPQTGLDVGLKKTIAYYLKNNLKTRS